MIQRIYHLECPKKTGDVGPEYKWGGFSMVNHADYVCDACSDTIMIEEESNLEVQKRNYEMELLTHIYDKNNNLIQVGDYVKLESFRGDKIIGVVSIISEYKIGVETSKMHYSYAHKHVEKVLQDEFMLYKLES